MLITDCHLHLQPVHLLNPMLLRILQSRPEFAHIAECVQSPSAFLKYLDASGIDRAMIINAIAPAVTGGTFEVNEWAVNYCKAAPERLLPCGAIDPVNSQDIQADIDNLLRLNVRLIKLHPPHQFFYPNAYLNGDRKLEAVYRAAEKNKIPIMFHTGTSNLPNARNKYADPMYLDDVALDFPKMTILIAHGGRPLWMETATFLVRRHRNVYLDICGVPPHSLLEFFPRLDKMAAKTLFGTDWPEPGVSDVGKNLEQFRALPLSPEVQEQILSRTALSLWPA